MNKKYSLLLLLVIVIAGLSFWFLKEKSSTVSALGAGRVAAVDGNVVTVEGFLDEQVDAKDRKPVTVHFTTDASTKFTKKVLIIDAKKYLDKGPFTPETRIESGKLSDLAKGTVINSVSSTNSLKDGGSATATEINYTAIQYEK